MTITATVVTVPAALLRAEAAAHAAAAKSTAQVAALYLAHAVEVAATLPDSFRTPGDATASDVLALIREDADKADADARTAERARLLAEFHALPARLDVPCVARNTEDARVAAAAAAFRLDSVRRFAAYLTA